ncbi:hypothetical protein [Azospirillum sp. SYSU D00513]|uniref:hypothetical protein n=1 Tax=Azospirillum sp. SYSU D00513 TaxID=2812561 RepID=UPI001A976CE1|nr:hypothetical protein [Azospirillum sp. SYSU D00513]
MFRRITLVSLLLLAVSACADAPARPAASGVEAQPRTVQSVPQSTPRPGDDSPLLNDHSGGNQQSCQRQCERTFNICGDSVAARSQSGDDSPDRPGLFSPINNCRDEMQRCLRRCGSPN